MKINIIKQHHLLPLGEADVTAERANYLISVGIAEPVKEKKESKTAQTTKENKTVSKRETK